MKHRYELYGALVCAALLFVLTFVVGMRSGLHDAAVASDAALEKLKAEYETEILNLEAQLTYEQQVEHVEYTYTPLPVDYPTVPSVDESDATIIAKTLWGEYRDATNYGQCSAVVWCILNRVDAGYGDVEAVCTTGQYHGYNAGNPVDAALYDIVIDVMTRWELEKIGANTDVGRTLPAGYLWFEGNGRTNTYRNAYSGGEHITP